MAFRTVVGQDYKAKNSLDDWIEKQEERSRTGKRVENSLAHNAAQAAVLASDAVSRGLHKGWVMAQKGAWAVKQMQLEAELASSGMQQGMQTAAASQRQERAQIVVEPLQPISLQTVRQVGPMVTIKWTTKLFVGNSSRTEALLSITQAQVMVNGKFRPQTFPLGLRESGERKLELTVDVGDPGDHAVQIRQLDNEKWSRWSEAHAVQVSKSATPSAKLQRRKTTAKAETGIFSRALSAGGAPLFLATISQEGTTPDNMPGKSTLETSAGPDAAEKETTEKHDDGASTHAVGRPEKEQGAYAEKGKEPPSEPPAALGKAPAAAPMFGRTISAPAAPAWLLRRSASVAVNPSALETSLDASAHKVLDNSMSSSLDTSTTRDEETLKAADTASQQRIAPSRARAGATATFSRAMSAPTVPSPGATGAPANRNESVERAKPRVPSPPTDEREGGFRRTGSAARAAAAGIARFRRAASTVTSVLRVASAGKDREVGTGGEGQNAGENAKDDLHMKSAERSDGFAMFGFKRTMSAPSAPIGDGFARTTSDAAKSSATSAFARLRDLPFSAKENETAGPAAERPESPQEQSIGIEVHLGLSVPLINGAKEIQIKSAVAAMAGVNGEALVIDGLENAWSGSKMHLRLAIPQSNVDKVRLRINLDRLNLELKRSNLPNAKGIKEEKPGFKAANLKKRHTIGASGQGGLSGMDFSEFSKLMGNEEPSQMSLTIDVIAPKYEVMLMYDSLQEGILETTALNKWPKSSVKFLSQHEVKGTRLQPSKVIVAWNLEAPARARDMMLEAMEDSETGLRKWAEKKGLPQVKVVELTITKVAKPISRFKRAATKVSIANSFLAAAKRNVEATEDSGQFTRSTSAPGIQIAESQELDQSSLSLESQGPELGGFKRTPSAPDAVGPFTASKPASEKGVDKDPSDGAGVHERGSSIVEPMITSPGITTRINSNNLAITRTSSGGVYVHPAAEKPRTSAILPFFSRAESAVKSEIAYEDDHFSRVPSGASVHEGGAAGGRDFSRASSAERAAGFLLQASQGVLNIFSRASSSASQTKTGSGEDKFSRAGSSGDDVFSRAGSARSDAKFSRAGSAAPAETTSGTNSLGESADAAQMSLFRREEESVHTDGISTVLPSIQKYSAATGADEGPKTPIMHIEPRRLGIKKAYHKPSTTAAGSGVKRLVKPKSSGGAADEFERAPSLTTLAPPKPKTAPKEESQAAIDAKRVRKTRRRNGYAAHTWSSGETYEGEWKDGVMHGKGFYRYADDYRDENRARAMDHMHRYEGEFREGKFNGKGIKHSQNGDRYEGDFLDGKFHGRGVFFCKETGETYEGGFWKGRFHGRGVQLSKDGSRLSVLYDAKKQDS